MALRQIENQFHGRLRSMVEQAYFPPFPLPIIRRERKREREGNLEEITKKTRHRKSSPIFHDRLTGFLASYTICNPRISLREVLERKAIPLSREGVFRFHFVPVTHKIIIQSSLV